MTLVATFAHFFVKKSSPGALERAAVLPLVPFKFLHPLTIRTITIQILFALILPTAFSGFTDLGSVTLCITRTISLEMAMGLSVGLSLPYIVAGALTGFTIWLSVRDLLKKSKESRMGADEEAWAKKSLKEKIQVVKTENGYDQLGVRTEGSSQG